MSRRLVRGLVTAAVGNALRGVSWPDVGQLSHIGAMQATARVDFTIKKLEPKIAEDTLKITDFLQRSTLFQQILGEVYGFDYVSLLNKFTLHLFQMHTGSPVAAPLKRLFALYAGAWSVFTHEVD